MPLARLAPAILIPTLLGSSINYLTTLNAPSTTSCSLRYPALLDHAQWSFCYDMAADAAYAHSCWGFLAGLSMAILILSRPFKLFE